MLRPSFPVETRSGREAVRFTSGLDDPTLVRQLDQRGNVRAGSIHFSLSARFLR